MTDISVPYFCCTASRTSSFLSPTASGRRPHPRVEARLLEDTTTADPAPAPPGNRRPISAVALSRSFAKLRPPVQPLTAIDAVHAEQATPLSPTGLGRRIAAPSVRPWHANCRYLG